MDFTKKELKLINYMQVLADDGLAVAFSGGVDSTLILRLAIGEEKNSLQKNIVAFTFNTMLNPKKDMEIAKKICDDYNVRQVVINVNRVENPKIKSNDHKRCYYCKYELFSKIAKLKSNCNLKHIVDGSNFDDTKVYRPGRQASKELGVISPLEDCGFTKDEVRTLAKKLDISVAQRPSAPCMLTRFPYDTDVDFALFPKIEHLENEIRTLGFYNVRIRVHGQIARIEVDKEDIVKLAEKLPDFSNEFKQTGFKYVTIDMDGFRSGSMDE